MAELKAEVIRIEEIVEHPNADRMELVVLGGYNICVQKDMYRVGDMAIYIPVDSVLNERLESIIFGPDSKVKLNKHRVRAIRLRGAVSNGMLIPFLTAFEYIKGPAPVFTLGMDVTSLLGITKYQPPEAGKPRYMQAKAKRHQHPDFHRYTDIQNLRKYMGVFDEGDQVYFTEKVHGTNFRAGWVRFKPRTFWQKLKTFFRLSPDWEFVYGSHNVQLQDGKTKDAFNNNVYKRCVTKYELKHYIPKGEIWYGEIAGPGIQKGFGYGIPEGHFELFLFDIKRNGTYLNFDAVTERSMYAPGVRVVPYWHGSYRAKMIEDMIEGGFPSDVCPGVEHPVEGYVVRSFSEEQCYAGRKVLKLLTDEYLLSKGNTDWH